MSAEHPFDPLRSLEDQLGTPLKEEDDDLTLLIFERLGLSDQQKSIRIPRLLRILKKGVAYGQVAFHAPNRTPSRHMRRWIEEEDVQLVNSFLDWVAYYSYKTGRTPRAVRDRLKKAIDTMHTYGEHITL